MANKWELCFFRPPVTTGAEMFFAHPDNKKNKVFRSVKSFLESRNIKVGFATDQMMEALSLLLMDGWEPMEVHGPARMDAAGPRPDLGPLGYSFRRLVA